VGRTGVGCDAHNSSTNVCRGCARGPLARSGRIRDLGDSGWGFSNTSLTSPGPNLEVEVGEHVTLNLTSLDGRNHNWFIDYNDNSVVDANESYSDSGTFRGNLQYDFTVGNQTGTFVYRSRFNGDGNLWGNITVRPAGFLGGLLGNPLLLAGIVAVIVAIVAVAIWARRRPRQPEEPPAE